MACDEMGGLRFPLSLIECSSPGEQYIYEHKAAPERETRFDLMEAERNEIR